MATGTRTIRTTRGARDAWALAEGATVRLPRDRRLGALVRVERGTVLVTQEGDLEDHVLEAGDEIVLNADGLAVAWAFTDAAISMHEAQAAAGALPAGVLSP